MRVNCGTFLFRIFSATYHYVTGLSSSLCRGCHLVLMYGRCKLADINRFQFSVSTDNFRKHSVYLMPLIPPAFAIHAPSARKQSLLAPEACPKAVA